MRVVLDTNLIVRAVRPGNHLGRALLLACIAPPHQLILSSPLFFELYRVLRYEHVRALHRLSDAEIDEFLDALYLASVIAIVQPITVGPLIEADPRDDHVLLTAIAGKADILGSNNRHFFAPAVRDVAEQHGIRILRDTELLPLLRQSVT